MVGMKFDPNKHHRRSIRLPHYDYTMSGAYFVTLCCYRRECWLGEIREEVMYPNAIAQMVTTVWEQLPNYFPFVTLDAFVVMPNHIRGIIFIDSDRAETSEPTTDRRRKIRSRSLGAIVGNFKSVSTRKVNRMLKRSGVPLWQRNYYETIIRDDRHLNNVRQYIIDNPRKWAEDEENPDSIKN